MVKKEAKETCFQAWEMMGDQPKELASDPRWLTQGLSRYMAGWSSSFDQEKLQYAHQWFGYSEVTYPE